MRLVIPLLALLSAWNVQAKPVSARLNQVKKEILETRLQISRYENMEESLQKDSAALKDKKDRSLRQIHRLKTLLVSVRDKEKKLSARLTSLEEDSAFFSSTLKGDLRAYLTLLRSRDMRGGTRSLWEEELIRFSILDKAAMIRALSGSAQKTARAERETRVLSSGLIAQSRQALIQNKESLNAYEEKRALIEDLDRKKLETQEKEKRLEESARALSKLLKKLSRPSPRRKIIHQVPHFVTPHRLPWPVDGTLLSAFGRQKNRELNVWVIHQGIVIKTSAQAPVKSVAAGRVIFSGPFRSYGRIIIVDHGRNFFSIYGRLGRVLKKTGDSVAAGETIASTLPDSAKKTSSLYFELRQGTLALNPARWLK